MYRGWLFKVRRHEKNKVTKKPRGNNQMGSIFQNINNGILNERVKVL